MVYRAKVAHTREAKKPDDAGAPAAPSSGPVEPLQATPAPAVAPAPAAADGGTP